MRNCVFQQHLDSLRRKDSLRGAETTEISVRLGHYSASHFEGSAYNATILSQLLTYKERLGDVQGVAHLTQVSPVAWQHINLCGRYEFTKELETINLEAIVQALAEVQITPEEFAATP